MWKQFHDAKQQADARLPLYFLDLSLKNFDQIYYQDSLPSLKKNQQLIHSTLSQLSPPPLACAFPACDQIQCIVQVPDQKAMMQYVAALDDAIHQLPSQALFQRLFLGIGIYEMQQEDDLFTCMRNAKLARTASKDSHKMHTHIEWYDASLVQELLQRRMLEQHLYQAIGCKSFQMVIQPKVSCKHNRICGGEALIRLPFSDGMSIDTFRMITLAESNGLIEDIDAYMFEEVCRYQKETLARHDPLLPISVNISRIHFQHPDFFQRYLDLYRPYHLPDYCIELEITESAQMEGNEEAIPAFIEQAHAAGFRVALDDFGSGQSSLGLLSTMNIDTIKLDRSFFLHENKDSQIIVETILQLAKALSISTVAEGIETKKQVKFLKKHQCDMIQGFYYAKAMKVEDYRSFIKTFAQTTSSSR